MRERRPEEYDDEPAFKGEFVSVCSVCGAFYDLNGLDDGKA